METFELLYLVLEISCHLSPGRPDRVGFFYPSMLQSMLAGGRDDVFVWRLVLRQLAEERRKQKRMKRELENQLADLEKEQELLRRTGNEMETQLKREIEILKSHLSDQEKTFRDVRADLESQYRSVLEEKEKMTARIQDLTDDLDRLQEAARRAETLKSELEDLELSGDISQEDERKKIHELMLKHEEDLKLLKAEIEEVYQAKKLLENEKTELDRKVQTLQNELNDLQNLYVDIQGKLSKALEEKEEENRRLSIACKQMEDEMTRLLDQTRQELLQKTSLEREEREKLEQRNVDLEREVSMLKQDNRALQDKLDRAEREYLLSLLSSKQKEEKTAARPLSPLLTKDKEEEEGEHEGGKEAEAPGDDEEKKRQKELRSKLLEQENQTLAERLARLHSKYESMHALFSEENSSLKEALEKEKHFRLESSSSSAESLAKENSRLRSQLADLVSENRLLKMEAGRRERAPILHKDEEEEEEEGDLQNRLSRLQETCMALTEKVSQLENEAQMKTRENSVLSDKINQIQDKYTGKHVLSAFLFQLGDLLLLLEGLLLSLSLYLSFPLSLCPSDLHVSPSAGRHPQRVVLRCLRRGEECRGCSALSSMRRKTAGEYTAPCF